MRITKFKRALTTNANTSSFASVPSQIARPSGDGVVEIATFMPGKAGTAPWGVRIMPIGLGASNDAFSMRLLGWNSIGDPAPQGTQLWITQPMIEIACTVGAATGVAGSPVLVTELFVDTIAPVTLKQPTITSGASTAGRAYFYSPADDTAAYIDVPLMGVELIQFQWDQTTNSPTMNALIRFLWDYDAS